MCSHGEEPVEIESVTVTVNKEDLRARTHVLTHTLPRVRLTVTSTNTRANDDDCLAIRD